MNIGGNTEYRARSLFGMRYTGIHYDDLFICNNQGMYKGGTSKLQQQLNSLEQKKTQNIVALQGVLIYPNPASSQFTLEYTDEISNGANLTIYDMLGNKVLSKNLNAGVNKTTLEISTLTAGLYNYKVTTTKGNQFIGKLTVQ